MVKTDNIVANDDADEKSANKPPLSDGGDDANNDVMTERRTVTSDRKRKCSNNNSDDDNDDNMSAACRNSNGETMTRSTKSICSADCMQTTVDGAIGMRMRSSSTVLATNAGSHDDFHPQLETVTIKSF